MAGGAVFENQVKTSFVVEGEAASLDASRKHEKAQKDLNKAAERTTAVSKQQAAAQKSATTTTTSWTSSQKAAEAAASGYESAQKSATEATDRAADVGQQLEKTLGDLAATREKEARAAMEAASSARKAAQAADTSTKEGRQLAKQQNQVAMSHDRAAKTAQASADSLRKQEAAQEKAAAGAEKLTDRTRKLTDEQGRFRKSLDRVGKAAKRGAMIVGGMAVAGVAAGIKLNAQWEAQQASFATLLGSMDRAVNFTERLRSVSAESPLRLTEYAEASKLLLGFGMQANKVVPTLSAINKAVVATGQGEEAMMRVTRALGLMQGRGKATARELNMLVQANLAPQKDLQKQLGLTGDQVANIGKEGIAADKVINAITTGWTQRYGPAYKNASETWHVQTAKLKKDFEQLLRVGTQPIFQRLVDDVLPRLNEELNEVIDIIQDGDLTVDQKLTRIAGKIEEALGEVLAQIPRLIEKAIPPAAAAAGKLSLAVAKGVISGFTQANPIAKLFTAAAVIRMVGGKGALLAVGRALGGTMGIGVGQGMAAGAGGAAAGSAAAGGAAAGLAARGGALVKGVGKVGAWGAAFMAGTELVDAAISRQADDAMDQLDRIDDRGKGLIGSAQRLLQMNRIATTSWSRDGDQAHRLKQILEEINDVGIHRADQLKREGQQLLENLDLTKEQQRALEDALSSGDRAGARQQVDAGIWDLESGWITRMEDIDKVMARTQKNIAAGWNQGSKNWRQTTSRAMNAQVKAIKTGMNRSVIESDKGWERIRKIRKRQALITGKDPVGIAEGFQKEWGKTQKITDRQLRKMNRQLGKMPKDAREKAIDTMVSYAEGLVKKGKLPQEEMEKLTSSLRTRFGRTSKQAFDGLRGGAQAAWDALKKQVPGIFDTVKKAASTGWSALGTVNDRARDAQKKKNDRYLTVMRTFARKIPNAVEDIVPPTRTAYGRIASSTNRALDAMGSDETVSLSFQKRRKGGPVRYGFATGGMVPVAVSSGELMRYPDGRWVEVPGERVAADNVLTAVPPRTEVYTDSGRLLLGMGATRQEALEHQLPHFQKGGIAKPQLIGGALPPRSAGQAGIDSVHAAARKLVRQQRRQTAGDVSGRMSGEIGAIAGRILRRFPGLVITDSGVRTGNYGSSTSLHRQGRAVDIGGSTDLMYRAAEWIRTNIGRSLTEGIHNPNLSIKHGKGVPSSYWGSWWGAHADHIHIGKRAGGIVGMQGGGVAPYRVAQAAYRGGFPASLLQTAVAIAGAESGFNRLAHNQSGEDSRGLWQINVGPGANTQYQSWNLFDPLINAKAARGVYKGRGNWTPWSVYTNGRYQAFMARASKAVETARKQGFNNYDGKGGAGRSSKPKTKTVIRDDLKPLGVAAARRQMPRLVKPADGSAFGTAMNRAALVASIRRKATQQALVKLTKTTKRLQTGTGKGGAGGGRPRGQAGTGSFMARLIDGIGFGTGRSLGRLYRAGTRNNRQVRKAMDRLGRQLSHVGRFTIGNITKLQEQVREAIRSTIDPKSPGGRKITKAERALIRRSQSILTLTQAALGARAGRHVKQARKIARQSEQFQFRRDLRLRRQPFEAGSSYGIEFESASLLAGRRADGRRRNQLQKALEIARKAGDRKAIADIRSQLREVNNAIREATVGLLEKSRELIDARFAEAQAALERVATVLGLRDRGLAAGLLKSNVADTSPEALTVRADRIGDTIANLEAQRDAAGRAAQQYAQAGLTEKATDATVAAFEAIVAIAEAEAEQIDVRRQAALGAAQRLTDRAAGTSAMTSLELDRLEVEQRLAGTYESGAFARRDFILARIVPALTTELETMREQLAVIEQHGDEETVRQQRQAIAQKQLEILQAQLQAQEQIAENTDTKQIGGALAFQFGGELLTDQLILEGGSV